MARKCVCGCVGVAATNYCIQTVGGEFLFRNHREHSGGRAKLTTNQHLCVQIRILISNIVNK